MSILGSVWLDVEGNEYGVKKIKLDVDNSVISIEQKNESRIPLQNLRFSGG